MIRSIFLLLTFVFSTSYTNAQLIVRKRPDISKKEAEKRISAWYEKHAEGYSFSVPEEDADIKVTRYHPERAEEKNNLIQVHWLGMTITLAFDKPFDEIDQTSEGLQAAFLYVSVDDIYNSINTPGWNVYPRTPSSSNNKKDCVKFTKFENGEISFSLNWNIYTVFGYSTKEKCFKQRGIADGSVSEECMVEVRQKLPLEIKVSGKIMK